MEKICIKDLSFAYERNLVLQDVNLEFCQKDFLAIIGPNGGGKSTLLKLILGLLKPKTGQINISDRKSLAYVPQNVNANQIFPITCLEVVLMGRLSSKWFKKYDRNDYKKAHEALEMAGICHLANKNINSLSGGQKQRVIIARALCSDAKIILLDEPTSNIDTNGQIKIYSLLKKLNENIGIIIISHDVNVAVNFATKIAHVNKNLFMHEEIKAKHLLNPNNLDKHICPIELMEVGANKKGYIWRY